MPTLLPLFYALGSDPGLMEFKNGSVVFLEVKDDRKIKITGGSQPCPFWPLLVPVVSVMTLQVLSKIVKKMKALFFSTPNPQKYIFLPQLQKYTQRYLRRNSF